MPNTFFIVGPSFIRRVSKRFAPDVNMELGRPFLEGITTKARVSK